MADVLSRKGGESRDPKVEMLDRLHWSPDAMDRWVNKAWASGLGSNQEFTVRLSEYENDDAQLRADAARTHAWDKYRNQLVGGETEIAASFLTAHATHAARYSIGKLNADVKFLKNIEQLDVSNKIIGIHKAVWAASNLSQQQITSSLDSLDDDVRAAILTRPSVENVEPFVDWLKRLGKSNGWSAEDTRRARETSMIEWENGLSKVTDADWLVAAIERCLQIIAFGAENEKKSNPSGFVSTSSGLDEFLLKLQKSESPLTRDRANRWLTNSN